MCENFQSSEAIEPREKNNLDSNREAGPLCPIKTLWLVQNEKNEFNSDMSLSMKIICCGLAWHSLGLVSLAETIPTLLLEKIDEHSVEVSVNGGEVEPGWVLQDSYNGTDWRDLKILEKSPCRFVLSSAPTTTRFFRVVQKSLATYQETLTQARANWQTLGLVNYQYRSQSSVSGFLTDDVTLVENGSVKEWNSLLPPGFPTFSQGDQTIDDIFDRIQNAIDNDAHLITARYHPHLGYPESVYVDQSELIADEEWGVSIIEEPATPETLRSKSEHLWHRSGVKGYEFNLKYDTAWFSWEGIIRVGEGEAKVVGDGPSSKEHIVMTMDEMLTYIGEALTAGKVSSAAYDQEFGYPRFFSRDWHLTAFDGPGERFWISEFRQLEEAN